MGSSLRLAECDKLDPAQRWRVGKVHGGLQLISSARDAQCLTMACLPFPPPLSLPSCPPSPPNS